MQRNSVSIYMNNYRGCLARKIIFGLLLFAVIGCSSRKSNDRLLAAARDGDIATVKKLIQAGVSPSIAGGEMEETALIYAASNGYEDIVDLLITSGADLNAVDGPGRTALSWASISGHYRVCNSLALAGVDIDKRDFMGLTALHHAARKGHSDIIELLIRHGAVVDAVGDQGLTPLFLATAAAAAVTDETVAAHYGENYMNTIKALLNNGANPRHTNQDRESPLSRAEDRGDCVWHDQLLALLSSSVPNENGRGDGAERSHAETQ